MPNAIRDAQVSRLARTAAQLQVEYERERANDPWVGSPFAWIQKWPSGTRGKIGVQLVESLCRGEGLAVNVNSDSAADRVIAGRRVEIKFSTLWKSGKFRFQQLRNQNYQFAICLGISPLDAQCWIIPKRVLTTHVIGHTGQHTGKGGHDTFWLSFPAASPPSWLSSCGGSLADALAILRTW